MCGIAGIIGSCNPAADVMRVKSMILQLHHRGPDHQKVCARERSVIGHARLSIIDPAGGNQPLFSDDGQIAVVFNGEIYNYLELKQDLLSGYPFQTESDTEVILALYQRYGIDFVSLLNGQFAIALDDQRQGVSYLIRDRIGIAPLFYMKQGKGVWFASEIKSLLKVRPQGFELDIEGFADFIHLWAPLSPGTLYRGVKEVSPGCYLRIDQNGVTAHRYWDFEYHPDATDRPLTDWVDELDDLLKDAVAIRLRADVPVAAYLSGGLDSSIILSYLHRSGIDLESFSLTFSDPRYDEASFQQEVARYLGTRHNELLARNEDIAEHFESTVWHAESPLFRSSPTPMKLLSRQVHDAGYKVVLTGEGADEIFGGYDIFKEAKIRAFCSRFPDSQCRPALLRRLYPYLDFRQLNSTAYLKNAFGYNLEKIDELLYGHAIRMRTTSAISTFLHPDIKEQMASIDMEARARELLGEEALSLPIFNRCQYVESRTLMPGYILSSQGDRMLMANSVEGRYPFLDHRVMEFAGRLPNRYKMHGLKEKFILKKLAENRLPEAVVNRPKQPYRAPDIDALLQPMEHPLMEYLEPELLHRYGIFDERKTSFLIKKARSGKAISVKDNMAFTTILSSQIWMKRFINAT